MEHSDHTTDLSTSDPDLEGIESDPTEQEIERAIEYAFDPANWTEPDMFHESITEEDTLYVFGELPGFTFNSETEI